MPRRRAVLSISSRRRPIPAAQKPNALVSGCLARKYQSATGSLRNLIDNFVVADYTWAQMQPTSFGPLDTTVMNNIEAEMNWAQANTGTTGNPMVVRFRPDMGYKSPAWVKTASGGAVPWITDEAVEAGWTMSTAQPEYGYLPGGVPRWWTQGMFDAYADWLTKFMARLGGHPAFAELVIAMSMTQHTEPMLRQVRGDENRTNAANAGYTLQKDLDAYTASFQLHHEIVSPYGVATNFAFNPHQSALTVVDSIDRTLAVMDEMHAILGRMCVWQNCSHYARFAGDTDDYTPMYAKMENGALNTTPPIPHALQSKTLVKMQALTATDSRITTLSTTQQAVAWGGLCEELPVGCQDASAGVNQITVANATTLNPQFRANAAALLAN